MTSNIGSNYILESKNEMVKEELKLRFKPEFLNRIDEIITFNSLSKENIKNIISLELEKINKKLIDKMIKLIYDESVIEYILENAYDDNYGARPIKRFIQKFIETDLSKLLLKENISQFTNILVKIKDDKVEFLIKEK